MRLRRRRSSDKDLNETPVPHSRASLVGDVWLRSAAPLRVPELDRVPGALEDAAQKGVHSPAQRKGLCVVGQRVPGSARVSHTFFAPLPREARTLGDGSETWSLRHCPPESKDGEDCCLYEFVLRDGVIATYRTTGACMVNCKMRPEAKVQACIDDARVPDHYGSGR